MQHYDAETGDITMALTGESLITRPMRAFREPAYLGLLELLRDADVTFTNAEMLFHDYEGYPREESKGTYMRCAPEIAADLKWMGIDIVATANNHAFDFLTEGVLVNRHNLEAAGLVPAGTGENMAAARAAGYFDSARGRVGLVASTDDVNVPGGRAGNQRSDMRGRPGTNHIRVEKIYPLASADFDALKRIDESLGLKRARETLRKGRFPKHRWLESEDELYFAPSPEPPAVKFRRADETSRYVTEVDAEDWEGTLRSLKEARHHADWLLYSHHTGYQGETAFDPADHFIEMSHEAIDNGVDVVIGHGPHRDRGIEIYRGKPIFYSLGDFILQTDSIARQPADNYERFGLAADSLVSDFYAARTAGGTSEVRRVSWISFVPVLRWRAKQLRRIELYPVSLGMGLPRGTLGRPVLADVETAAEVIGNLQTYSAQFGTTIEFDGSKGIIEVG